MFDPKDDLAPEAFDRQDIVTRRVHCC